MARKISTKKKFPQKDLRYNSFLISLFINRILKKGKKSIAKKILYTSLETIKNRLKLNPLVILEKAIKNISPQVFLKTKYIGEKGYKIPFLLNKFKSTILAIKWILLSSKKRKTKSMSESLSYEIIDAFKGVGNSMKKKEEIYKIAESNKVFLSLIRN